MNWSVQFILVANRVRLVTKMLPSLDRRPCLGRQLHNLASAAAVAAVVLGAASHAAGQGASARRGVPVEAQPVTIRSVMNEVNAVGSLRANKSIIVRPEIAGVIASIEARETERVKKGALLFSLDDTIYRAELEKAEASLRLSVSNYERALKLYKRGAGTGQARDEALSKVQTDRAAVNLAKARLSKTKLHAPFAGIVGLSRVDVGAYVNVGQDLTTLDDADPLELDFELPERYLRFIRQGQTVSVTVDALPGETFKGKVSAIATRIDPAGRSLTVRALIPNSDNRLKPGLFARIALVLRVRKKAVVVLEQSIIPRGRDFYVYKVVNGKAALTKVEIGLRRYGSVEIVAGLAPGDIVVTAGQLKLSDGTPVTVVKPRGG
jgi:membrane fusion protein (multidrug efflux system)